MPWNWELPDWPKFRYDCDPILEQEKRFLLDIGGACAYLKNIDRDNYHHFVVEILSTEGLKSSKIEGELLDRESLQASIKRHFGLQPSVKNLGPKETGMAELLCDVYDSFKQPLTHQMLYHWHATLFSHQADCGCYRTHLEPMQIVSNRYDIATVFFEAPPSVKVHDEMEVFIRWFNALDLSKGILGQAAVAHVYFESIHPFEDGNGRIGRMLVEKLLSQGIGQPVLIAVSKILEAKKKQYYAALEKCNLTLDIQAWVEFFVDVLLEGQQESMNLLYFLIEKSKILSRLAGHINLRQEKVLLKMFAAGPHGFQGGLSAENYLAITKTSRATATRDLTELVQKEVLIKTGELRHTRYWLNLPKSL